MGIEEIKNKLILDIEDLKTRINNIQMNTCGHVICDICRKENENKVKEIDTFVISLREKQDFLAQLEETE